MHVNNASWLRVTSCEFLAVLHLHRPPIEISRASRERERESAVVSRGTCPSGKLMQMSRRKRETERELLSLHWIFLLPFFFFLLFFLRFLRLILVFYQITSERCCDSRGRANVSIPLCPAENDKFLPGTGLNFLSRLSGYLRSHRIYRHARRDRIISAT